MNDTVVYRKIKADISLQWIMVKIINCLDYLMNIFESRYWNLTENVFEIYFAIYFYDSWKRSHGRWTNLQCIKLQNNSGGKCSKG